MLKLISKKRKNEILKRLELISPHWTKVLKQGGKLRHQNFINDELMLDTLDPRYCVVGESHHFNPYFNGCAKCGDYCGDLVSLISFSGDLRTAQAIGFHNMAWAQLEAFVNHFKTDHKMLAAAQ